MPSSHRGSRRIARNRSTGSGRPTMLGWFDDSNSYCLSEFVTFSRHESVLVEERIEVMMVIGFGGGGGGGW